jgi:hypothetical protein
MAMMIRASLELETGTVLDHFDFDGNLLLGLLHREDEETCCCLRFIDPYGDTVFNSLQFPVLLEEIRRSASRSLTMEHKWLVERLESMVLDAMTVPHRYVKFVGD